MCNMCSTLIIGFVIWLVGAVVAWFQIKHWNKGNKMNFPRDYYVLLVFSLLSWAIYPIYAIERIYNKINNW